MPFQDDRALTIHGAIGLDEALIVLQRALVRIEGQLSMEEFTRLGVELESAELSLETLLGAEIGLSAKVAVVTATGSAAVKATNTLVISLRPPKVETDKFGIDSLNPETNLVDLSNGMFQMLLQAVTAEGVPLELKTGSVKVQLVVSSEGKIEVAPVGFWKTVLKLVGVEASASVAGDWVSTSSITLKFKNKKD